VTEKPESVEEFPGQRSPENMQKLADKQREIAAKAVEDAMAEASGDVEEVMRLLSERWMDKGFSPEQIVWCIALLTINWRETFPVKSGGKEAFDRICREAKAYYDANI
jgi:hypothetical protein